MWPYVGIRPYKGLFSGAKLMQISKNSKNF